MSPICSPSAMARPMKTKTVAGRSVGIARATAGRIEGSRHTQNIITHIITVGQTHAQGRMMMENHNTNNGNSMKDLDQECTSSGIGMSMLGRMTIQS